MNIVAIVLDWAVPGLFLFILIFQNSWQKVYTTFADDWIEFAGLWYRKQPLY